MPRAPIAALALAFALCTGAAQAQTANSAPTSRGGVGSGNVSRTPPSVGGGAAAQAGTSRAGAPTPLERTEEERAQKSTSSICKGC